MGKLIFHLPISDGIFDMVAGGIYEHTTLVPRTTLYTYVLVDGAQTLQFTVTNRNTWNR